MKWKQIVDFQHKFLAKVSSLWTAKYAPEKALNWHCGRLKSQRGLAPPATRPRPSRVRLEPATDNNSYWHYLIRQELFTSPTATGGEAAGGELSGFRKLDNSEIRNKIELKNSARWRHGIKSWRKWGFHLGGSTGRITTKFRWSLIISNDLFTAIQLSHVYCSLFAFIHTREIWGHKGGDWSTNFGVT